VIKNDKQTWLMGYHRIVAIRNNAVGTFLKKDFLDQRSTEIKKLVIM